MIEYVLQGRKFSFSYQELRGEYFRFRDMTNKEFRENLPAAAHLACVICFFKEIPTYVALCDTGIIHELIHLMHIPEGNTTSLEEIRKLFCDQLRLA